MPSTTSCRTSASRCRASTPTRCSSCGSTSGSRRPTQTSSTCYGWTMWEGALFVMPNHDVPVWLAGDGPLLVLLEFPASAGRYEAPIAA